MSIKPVVAPYDGGRPSKRFTKLFVTWTALTVLSGSASVAAVSFDDIATGGAAGLSYQRTESTIDALWDPIRQAGVFSFDDLPPLSRFRTNDRHLAEVQAHLMEEIRPAAFD